jgi:hypothetical protein
VVLCASATPASSRSAQMTDASSFILGQTSNEYVD